MSALHTVAEYLAILAENREALRTERDTLLLYTGAVDDSRSPFSGILYASFFADVVVDSKIGLVSLASTEVGKWLDGERLYHPTEGIGDLQATEIWSVASRMLCEEACGNVTLLVSRNSQANSIFYNTELPALFDNPEVHSLNGIPLSQLQATYSMHPDPLQTFASLRDLLLERSPRMEFTGPALAQRLGRSLAKPKPDHSIGF